MYSKIMPSWGLCNPKIWPNTRVTMETIVGSVLTSLRRNEFPLSEECQHVIAPFWVKEKVSAFCTPFRLLCSDAFVSTSWISDIVFLDPTGKAKMQIFFWENRFFFFFVRVTLCYKVKCDMDFNTWFVLRESNVNW